MRTVYQISSCLLLKSALKINANPAQLENMLKKIEQDTFAFAHKMEELILDRCQFTSDYSCYQKSYHRCDSKLPYPTCPGKDLAIQKCGKGEDGGCGGLFDFTKSVVSVAPDNTDPFFYQNYYNGGNSGSNTIGNRIKDGVCSTLRAEDYMVQSTIDDEGYWSDYQVKPPARYYGTDDGVFRIFPGSPGTCPYGMNTYDPRIRPWYIAASSGPKDVILILDTSGSMELYRRMEIMQDAARRVINTLGVSDHFAVIEFNTDAMVLGNDPYMIRATKDNKDKMIKKIDSFEADGGTYYKNSFDLAFRTLEESIEVDRSSGCNRAILFLSDGELTDDATTLKKSIKAERAKYSDKGKEPPVLFTYSFGSGADMAVPKDIACENDGIWARIGDGGDLAKSMGAYYKYFAYGLGDNNNENFVAWVEPYVFSTGVGLGTTASAPVYDRSVDPPVLAGVVGMDINFLALERAFDDTSFISSTKSKVIDLLVQRSGAVCPKLNITTCQLESLRVFGSGEDENANDSASCKQCAESETQPLKPPLCDNYPEKLWDNRLNQGLTFEQRTCCNVGQDPEAIKNLTDAEILNGVCTEEKLAINSSLGMIIGVVVGALVCGTIVCIFLRKRQKASQNNPYSSQSANSNFNSSYNSNQNPNNSITAHVVNAPTFTNNEPIQSFENDIVVLPPPTAPSDPVAVAVPVSN